MKRAVSLSALIVLCGCATAPKALCPDTQQAVEHVAGKHPEVVRLTVHAVPPAGGDMCVIASSLAAKLGKPSDPEDHRAVASGETVVLDEPGAVDYTVPVRMREGRYTAAVGVTMKSGGEPAAQMAAAKTIAAEVAAMMK